MTGSRLFGILWVFLAIIYFIASDSWIAPVILLLTAGFSVYLAASVWITGRFLRFRFAVEEEVMKKFPVNCRMEVRNRCVLPLAKAVISLTVRNRFTGETGKTAFSVSIPGRGRERVSWQLKSSCAGEHVIAVQRVTVYDFMGIFCRRIPVSLEKSVCVTPETFYSAVDITNRNAPNMDSDYYSDTRKGFDSGETFSIREYIPGDSTKFIHWKLSSKLDKILIRELGFPIQNSILILLETGWQKEPVTPSCADAMAEAFVSLSQSLSDGGMDHHVCWFDHSRLQLLDYEITDRESVSGVMKEVLSAPIAEDEFSVISHYLENFRDFQAAHVVYITCFANPDELRPLLSNCCLTVLKCVSEDMQPGDEMLPSGIAVVPFYGGTIREDLYQLNI